MDAPQEEFIEAVPDSTPSPEEDITPPPDDEAPEHRTVPEP